MNKQSYLVAVVILALVAAGGIYWYSQTPAYSPGSSAAPISKQAQKVTSDNLAAETTDELANFDKDAVDLKDLNSTANDAALDAASNGLSAVNNI